MSLNITLIKARDLTEAWFLSLRKVLTEGRQYKIERGSYAGQQRRELDYIVVHVEHPDSRPLVPTVPPGVPSPSTMDYIESYLPYLMTSHKAEGEQYQNV
jgi:thymidylate synthase